MESLKPLVEIANQLCSLEKKIVKDPNSATYMRHLLRIKQSLEDLGITYHNPEGEKYTDSRTDIEATLTGEISENMFISEVIKPIVIHNKQIVQSGIVIVGS